MVDVLFELPELTRRYTVIGFDQRGTGASGLLRCKELERDGRLRSTDAAERCAQRLGPERAFYTTPDTVEDMEAIRQAVGARTLTLFGISYGTELALAYARAYPGARRPADPRLRRGPGRERSVRPRRLPRDGPVAGLALPRPLPRAQRRPGRGPARRWSRSCAPLRCAAPGSTRAGAATRARCARSRSRTCSTTPTTTPRCAPACRWRCARRSTTTTRRRCCGCWPAPTPTRSPRTRATSRPPATRPCARRRRCRGRAARRWPIASRSPATARSRCRAPRSPRSTPRSPTRTRSTSACAGRIPASRRACSAAPIPWCRR